MKHLKLFGTAMVLGLAFLFQSCDDNDGYSIGDIGRDYVTTHVDSQGTVTFTGDSWGTMWVTSPIYPVAIKEGQRAVMYFNPLYDNFQGYDVAVQVEDLIPILTKDVEELTEENEAEYGDDPVRVTDAWIGGGYMNLIFAQRIPASKPHRVSLVMDTTDEDVQDGYVHLEYRYNTYGDTLSSRQIMGAVSYNLNTLDMADKKGIKMRINSAVNGERVLTFDTKQQPTPKSINEIENNSTFVK